MRQSSLAKIGDIDAVSISIDREIASRYDDVKIVADNIDAITLLGTPEAVAAMGNVIENIDLVLNAVTVAAAVVDEAELARDEAEDARDAILGMDVATGAQGTSVVWDGTTLTIPRGDTGLQGIQGVQGEVGPQGIQGPIGATGPQGVKGDTGAQGIQGVKGDTGLTGNQGIQGIQGLKGDKGDTGAQGIQGVQGVKGDTGDIGPANTLTVGTVSSGGSPSASITGVSPNQILNLVLQQGPQGIQGIQGLKGDVGDDGRGIVSVVKTSGTGAAGTTDVYTITYTDASQSSFNVYNGADGLGNGDMLKATYDTNNNGKVDLAEVADKWTTGRTLTIGSTGKSIDGSGDVSWSLAEIGAQAAGSYQPLDADLTSIAGLAGTSGLLKKTATNTWTLDTAAYTTNLGTVTGVTGTAPVVSSGGVAPAISLAVGYGDTLNPFASKTANYVLAAPSGSAGAPTFRAITAADIPVLNQTTTGSAATLTTGRTLGITGDMTWTSPSFDGSGNVTAAGTLATVNSNVGAFTNANVTVNAKGLVTAVSNGTTYSHPTGDGNLHVPATGTTNNGKVLTAGSTAGSLSWTTVSSGTTDHTLLSNIGTRTHAQLESDIALKANIVSPVFTGNVTGLGVATGTSFNSITALASVVPVAAGTAAVGTSTTVARQDHVHPAQTNITGNATTATTANALNSSYAYTGVGFTANTGAFRAQNWGGVPTNGVTYYGNANSYIYKVGATWEFSNEQSGFINNLNTGGAIVTQDGGTWSINATSSSALVGDETNWSTYRSRSVANMLGWKNHGNGHVIFDASASTSPTGSAVNNTNSQSPWSPTYPTLMAWNGIKTHGVRVDSARTADSTTYASAFTTAVGNAPSYACRAWVNFDGTGTVAIRASGNVSSITDNGVGDYNVNFTTAMPDVNYSGSIDGRMSAGFPVNGMVSPTIPTSSAFRICTYRGDNSPTLADTDFVLVNIFR